MKMAFGNDVRLFPRGTHAMQWPSMVEWGVAIAAASVNAGDLLGQAARPGTIESDADAGLIAGRHQSFTARRVCDEGRGRLSH